jgi:hypothetical protein
MNGETGRDDPVVELLLGQLDREEHRLAIDAVSRDPRLAERLAETAELFERMRTLTVSPSGRVRVVVRQAILRRRRLRLPEPRGVVWRRRAVVALQCAVAAAVVVLGVFVQNRMLSPPRAGVTGASLADAGPGPAAAARATMRDGPREGQLGDLLRAQELVGRAGATQGGELQLAANLVGGNKLASLRVELQHRASPQARREALLRAGSSAELEVRIASLAGEIAARLEAELTSDRRSLAETSASVRALLVAGSTPGSGPHAELVRRGADAIVFGLAQSRDGDLALALAAITDLAIVVGPPFSGLVHEHAERLVAQIESREPGTMLLQRSTSATALAEAGRVLALAPVFGLPPARGARARQVLAAHLRERLDYASAEQPQVQAALLYGFGDLVDVDDLDRRLRAARNRMLRTPELFAALQQRAWSMVPPRPGWTQVVQDLRRLATATTPGRTQDAAALLMALATCYAAPGIGETLSLSD